MYVAVSLVDKSQSRSSSPYGRTDKQGIQPPFLTLEINVGKRTDLELFRAPRPSPLKAKTENSIRCFTDLMLMGPKDPSKKIGVGIMVDIWHLASGFIYAFLLQLRKNRSQSFIYITTPFMLKYKFRLMNNILPNNKIVVKCLAKFKDQTSVPFGPNAGPYK